MTQTDKGTDRSTNRDASHLKQTLDYHGQLVVLIDPSDLFYLCTTSSNLMLLVIFFSKLWRKFALKTSDFNKNFEKLANLTGTKYLSLYATHTYCIGHSCNP